MLDETDLERVKEIAIGFLMVRPIETDMPIILHHPFTNSRYMHYENKLLDLTKEESLSLWQDLMKKRINNATDIEEIFYMVYKPYAFALLKDIMPYLSKQDFTQILSNLWIKLEYPSTAPNVKKKDFVEMFRRKCLCQLKIMRSFDFLKILLRYIVV